MEERSRSSTTHRRDPPEKLAETSKRHDVVGITVTPSALDLDAQMIQTEP